MVTRIALLIITLSLCVAGAIIPHRRLAFRKASAGIYTPNAILMNGDYLLAENGVNPLTDTGNDSKLGILSVWLKPDLANNAGRYLFLGDSINPEFSFDGSEKFTIQLFDTAGNTALFMQTVGGFDSASNWTHIWASWDLGNARAGIWINGVSNSQYTVATLVNTNADWTRGGTYLVGIDGGSQEYQGGISELWIAPKQWAAGPSAWRADTHPADLGSDGSTPTGTAPFIYLRDPPASWTNNAAGTGDFNLFSGPLSAYGSTP